MVGFHLCLPPCKVRKSGYSRYISAQYLDILKHFRGNEMHPEMRQEKFAHEHLHGDEQSEAPLQLLALRTPRLVSTPLVICCLGCTWCTYGFLLSGRSFGKGDL